MQFTLEKCQYIVTAARLQTSTKMVRECASNSGCKKAVNIWQRSKLSIITANLQYVKHKIIYTIIAQVSVAEVKTKEKRSARLHLMDRQ